MRELCVPPPPELGLAGELLQVPLSPAVGKDVSTVAQAELKRFEISQARVGTGPVLLGEEGPQRNQSWTRPHRVLTTFIFSALLPSQTAL